jgi:hypothetical protein
MVRRESHPKKSTEQRCLSEDPPKNWGPRLGPGAPEGAFQMPVSFSHRRVGSSILASLSEAGGNDPPKIASKPLPPRLQLQAVRLLIRAHVPFHARSTPAEKCSLIFIKDSYNRR